MLTVTSSIASRRGLTRAKKPSPVFRWLSCTLTPSTVMLIELCGRPLTVESRLPPGVLTPGRIVTKSSALRLPIGSLRIWFASMVDVTAGDCVWMISDPPCDDDGLLKTADFESDLHRRRGRRR